MTDGANADDPAASLERAQASLLKALRAKPRAILEAKLRLVRNQRDSAVQAQAGRISQEYAGPMLWKRPRSRRGLC
jgi:phage-related minor tail protein